MGKTDVGFFGDASRASILEAMRQKSRPELTPEARAAIDAAVLDVITAKQQHDECKRAEQLAERQFKDKKEIVYKLLEQNEALDYANNEGSVSLGEERSFSIADKPTFFNYLKAKGVFEELATIHHQKLQEICKAEYDDAKLRGIESFEIPGIGKPYFYKKVNVTKRKPR